MRWLEVKKSLPLQGTITVPGSKNSSLGLLAACCLADEPVVLENIPNIQDYRVICEIAEDIGLVIEKTGYRLVIDPTGIHNANIDSKKASRYRASYYFIGGLLSKFKKVSIGYPGGDNFGSRPIDQHIKGFKAMGAVVNCYEDHYTVEADKLYGAEIYFDMITMGGTINLLLAAVRAEGRTVLYNAARDPEVVDVAILLSKMGANIKGAGTDKIVIDGVEGLSGCTHSAIPDRLIAAAFLISAGATGGKITVKDIIPEHLQSCSTKLMEAGLEFEVGDNYITASAPHGLHGISVQTGMYPGFGTDYQQPLTTLLTRAQGDSIIIDKIFPERTKHCLQLNRMGAGIEIDDSGIIQIKGGNPLRGAWVHATDVRAGICLLLAGLLAEGTTYITGIEHIERGYEDIVKAFSSLGARIRLREDDNMVFDADDTADIQLEKAYY